MPQPRNALQPELEHPVSRWRIYRAQAPPSDPNRFAVDGLASSTAIYIGHYTAIEITSDVAVFRKGLMLANITCT
jgi:hypothetical protein